MSAAAPHPRSDGRSLLESTYRGTVDDTPLLEPTTNRCHG
jgi:hypothetical protein